MSNDTLDTHFADKTRGLLKATGALSAISELDPAAQVRSMMASNGGEPLMGMSDADEPTQLLTKRENLVIFGIAHGLSNANIGVALGISPRTVEIHRKNLIRKLGASNSADAVRIAVKLDMV